MKKFETKEELVEWIETMHLQNTNGRETKEEMFRLGIEATIEELTEFNLFSIPVVVGRSEQLKAVQKLKDFAYEVCPLHREDDLEEIVGSL